MGKFNTQKNAVIQTVKGSVNGYHSSAAYWNKRVYLAGKADFLSQYALSKGLLSLHPKFQSPTKFTTTPAISANGSSNAIVWAIEKPLINNQAQPAVLHAYAATNISKELYNSKQAGQRDLLGVGDTFVVPTIMNGKVYVGTASELDVLGLLN